MDELAQKQTLAAQENHKIAVKNLHQTHAVVRKRQVEEAEAKKRQHEKRVEDVLELKANTETVRRDMQRSVEKKVHKRQEMERLLSASKDAMIAEGLNPYEEFRRKEIEEEAHRKKTKLLQRVSLGTTRLVDEMGVEEKRLAKRDAAILQAKAYEKTYRDSLGSHITEKKNEDYIREVTSEHVEVLDPTGRIAQIFPSKVTDIPDNSLGLGASARIDAERMKKITDKIRLKLKLEENDFGEYQRLVNAALIPEERIPIPPVNANKDTASGQPLPSSTQGSQQGTTQLNLTNEFGVVPGKTDTLIDVNLAGNKNELAMLLPAQTEVFTQSIEPFVESYYNPPILSKFEVDSFQRKKEKSKKRIEEGVPQVTVGRVFKGPGFVAKPSELIFKDFEVGKKYIKRFTLTNASYTFNSFKILPFDRDVEDFLTVTYERLGRMSAGVSCTIELAFIPLINEDLDTSIRFYSETGPGTIPVKCLKKRCAPKLQTLSIDFGRVTLGQLMQKCVQLRNTQCLCSQFTVDAMEVPSEVLIQDSAPEGPEGPAVESTIESADVGVSSEEEVMELPDSEEKLLQKRVLTITTSILNKKKAEFPMPLSLIPVADERFVNGYNSTQFAFHFLPLAPGDFEQQFKVKYLEVPDDSYTDEEGQVITREQILTVRGTGVESPIYMEYSEVLFDCSYFNKIYRKGFEIHNRGNVSVRVDIRVENVISDLIEVSPSMFFVQSGGSQRANIKFTPNFHMLESIKSFLAPIPNAISGYLMILPIRIDVSFPLKSCIHH